MGYSKRVLLALAETLAKHMIMLKDVTFNEILEFLDAIDACGKKVPTKIQDHPDKPIDTEKCNVSYEARIIKQMYVKLRGYLRPVPLSCFHYQWRPNSEL